MFTVFNVAVVEAHVCRLQEKFNRSLGRFRWSLPRRERCLCQGVVAPPTSGNQYCSVVEETVDVEDLWFTDDPTPLTNRNNWKRENLDDLLDRSGCCKFYHVPYLAIAVKHDDWQSTFHTSSLHHVHARQNLVLGLA